ncbi:hypothetical protein [Nocardioides sp. T2.26MG-1]|uniref:hypothetical protein n=1 Tax=Nocardioides sp. T2.26MG-1 TaxID=3041166 RepID=UPI002477AB83|nr:hypothetical protein [Nocardioides sp. T2.26MG-1]CAI9409325.1 hypothetical protein HIDPHFAB_01264 [Nocardioides sp. T2.26MG-1]
MSTDLRDVLHERLDHLTPPVGDLDAVRGRGRRLRRGRQGAVAGLAAVTVAAVVVGVLALGGGGSDGGERGIDPVGPLDFSQGLRAYADPGYVIHLGGREFPADRLEYLDTDAMATPAGVLFYAHGVPRLLAESGDVTDLEPDAARTGQHPTAKVDSTGAVTAYGAVLDGDLVVRVRDLDSGELLASRSVPSGTVVDAIDDRMVFLRTDAGTTVWDTVADRVEEVAGPQTRVADVRNGVLLYDGPRPTGPGASAYRLVKGAIDAQLTYDGGHVLGWSSRLESTDGGAPIVLDQKATFFAIDTDGSVLAAVYGHPARVYDCEVPSGHCALLGPLTTKGGDPVFIGVDM